MLLKILVIFLLFLFCIHRCLGSYKIDFPRELADNGLKARKCTVAMEELEKTKEIIDNCKNMTLEELDALLKKNLKSIKNDEDLDREIFGKMIICVYKRLKIISGNDYEISMDRGIEVFETGIGQNVNKFKDVARFHDVVLPLCYEKSLKAAEEAYGHDFLAKPVDPNVLPIFYYNLFSCQEKAIEKMCRMKEELSIVEGINNFKPTFGPLTLGETCHVYFTLKMKSDGTPELTVPYGIILPEDLLNKRFGEKCASILLEEAYDNEKRDPDIEEEGEDVDTDESDEASPSIKHTKEGSNVRSTVKQSKKGSSKNPSNEEESEEYIIKTVTRLAVHSNEEIQETKRSSEGSTELLQRTGHIRTTTPKKLPQHTITALQSPAPRQTRSTARNEERKQTEGSSEKSVANEEIIDSSTRHLLPMKSSDLFKASTVALLENNASFMSMSSIEKEKIIPERTTSSFKKEPERTSLVYLSPEIVQSTLPEMLIIQSSTFTDVKSVRSTVGKEASMQLETSVEETLDKSTRNLLPTKSSSLFKSSTPEVPEEMLIPSLSSRKERTSSERTVQSSSKKYIPEETSIVSSNLSANIRSEQTTKETFKKGSSSNEMLISTLSSVKEGHVVSSTNTNKTLLSEGTSSWNPRYEKSTEESLQEISTIKESTDNEEPKESKRIEGSSENFVRTEETVDRSTALLPMKSSEMTVLSVLGSVTESFAGKSSVDVLRNESSRSSNLLEEASSIAATMQSGSSSTLNTMNLEANQTFKIISEAEKFTKYEGSSSKKTLATSLLSLQSAGSSTLSWEIGNSTINSTSERNDRISENMSTEGIVQPNSFNWLSSTPSLENTTQKAVTEIKSSIEASSQKFRNETEATSSSFLSSFEAESHERSSRMGSSYSTKQKGSDSLGNLSVSSSTSHAEEHLETISAERSTFDLSDITTSSTLMDDHYLNLTSISSSQIDLEQSNMSTNTIFKETEVASSSSLESFQAKSSGSTDLKGNQRSEAIFSSSTIQYSSTNLISNVSTNESNVESTDKFKSLTTKSMETESVASLASPVSSILLSSTISSKGLTNLINETVRSTVGSSIKPAKTSTEESSIVESLIENQSSIEEQPASTGIQLTQEQVSLSDDQFSNYKKEWTTEMESRSSGSNQEIGSNFSSHTSSVESTTQSSTLQSDSGDLCDKWSEGCPTLIVDCGNISELANLDDLKIVTKILFLIENIYEKTWKEVPRTKLDNSLVEEYVSYCQDSRFNTTCEELQNVFKNGTSSPQFLKALLKACIRHGIFMNCSNVDRYSDEKIFNETKAKYARILFVTERHEPIMIKTEDITVSDINEYSKICKTDYLCKDIERYKKSKIWESYWRRVFEKCFRTFEVTCKNVVFLSDPSKLTYLKSMYGTVQFSSRVLSSLDVNTSVVKEWQLFCNKSLVVGCANVSEYLETEEDFINCLKNYSKITFLIFNVDEHIVLEQKNNILKYKTVKEFKLTCNDSMMLNSSCVEIFDALRNNTSYTTFQVLITNSCARNGVYINCSNVRKYLNEKDLQKARSKYPRIGFAVKNGRLEIDYSKDVDLVEVRRYHRWCESNYSCADVMHYRDSIFWNKIWKHEFVKCHTFVLACENIDVYLNETQLRNLKTNYKIIAFKEMVVGPEILSNSLMEIWSSSCNEILTISCKNISSILGTEAESKQTYSKITLLLQNIDEQIEVEVDKENLFLIEEFKSACQDEKFANTSCIDHFELKEKKNYPIVFKILSNACAHHTAYLNCTNAEKYLEEKTLKEAKRKFPRVSFVLQPGEIVVVKSEDITMFDMTKYYNGCKSEYFCKDVDKYKKSKLWERMWSKVFQKCLEKTLNYTCLNIDDLLEPSNLRNAKEFTKILFYWNLLEEPLVEDTSSLTSSTVHDLKAWCGERLTVSCTNFSKYLEDVEKTKKAFKTLVLVDNVEHLQSEVNTTNLNYSLIEEYKAACQDSFNTPCTIQYLKDMKKTSQNPFFDNNYEDELKLNCSNVHSYFVKKALSDAQLLYDTISFDMESDNPLIINSDDVTVGDIKEYSNGCRNDYFCKDMEQYKKMEDWESVWKDIFSKCLTSILKIYCSDFEKGLNMLLRKIRSGYQKIKFDDQEKTVVMKVSDVNGNVIKQWSAKCKWLVVGCKNITNHLGQENDLEMVKKEYAIVIIYLHIVDEEVRIEVPSAKLNYSLVDETKSSCLDGQFRNASCFDLFNTFKDHKKYKILPKFLTDACHKRGLYINCTNVEKYVAEKELDQAKRSYLRFSFVMESGDPVIVDPKKVTTFDTTEYNNGCKSDYFCSDRKKFKKSGIWKTLWKNIFEKCLNASSNHTCANIDDLLKPSKLKDIKTRYKHIGLFTKDHDEPLLQDSSLISISTINNWKVWCNDQLTISCANFSEYLQDFERSKKAFKTVVFLIDNVDESSRLSTHLEYHLVEEYEAACKDQRLNTTPCTKRYEKLKKVNYSTFVEKFFETCSEKEIVINCSNVYLLLGKEVLPNTMSSYKRIFFEMKDDPAIVNIVDQMRDLVAEYADGCSLEYFCKDRNEYKKMKDWETVWKEIFSRCVKDTLRLTCENLGKEFASLEQKEIHEGYTKVEFFYEQRGWRFLKDAAEVNATVLKEWGDMCHKWLIVGCGNFSKYLIRKQDFKKSMKNYKMVIFLLENIDEYIEIEKRSSNLTYSFVKEFNSSCKDARFTTTSCSRRFDEYTNGTDYETILKFFFSRCSRHEFYLNCSNSKKYITGIGIKSAKARYNRIVFRITNGNPVILPSREVTPAVITAYSDGCKDEYQCKEVERYKKRKDWDIFWKKVFEGCRENLTINCSDIEEFDNEIWVETLKNKYDYIKFQSLTLSGKDLNTSIVHDWKKICFPPLIIGCDNVSSYFNQDEFEASKKKYVIVSFIVVNIEESFQIDKQSMNLDNTFITEYNSSCRDPLFRDTPCLNRYEKFKDTTNYTTILKDFFAICCLHELYINCSNIDKHFKKDQIKEAINKHKRIVFQENAGKITVVSTKSAGIAEGINSFYDLCYDDEVLCSDRHLYKNKINWTTYWKEKFDVCLGNHVVLSCANVSEYVSAEKLQTLIDQFAKIWFYSLDKGKMMYLNTMRVNTSVVKVWNSSCDVKHLIVDCDNFTDYLMRLKNYRKTKVSYVTVTFIIRTVDEDLVIKKAPNDLHRNFVIDFKKACRNHSFQNTHCRERTERFPNITPSMNILTEFFNFCARNELHIECFNVGLHLDNKTFREARKKYKRISFESPDGTYKIFPNNSTKIDFELRTMVSKCSELIPCKELSMYKTKKNWVAIWKNRYDRCVKQHLQISCLNITNYLNLTNLKAVKDEYAFIGFTDNFKRKEIFDSLQVNSTLVQTWKKLCPDDLLVDCSNFSHYLYLSKDFYMSLKVFKNFYFIIDNVDEYFIMQKTNKKLTYKYVNQYRHSCDDASFKNTSCKDRYLKIYRTKNYRQILNMLFYTCSHHELFVNCSNAFKYIKNKEWSDTIKRITFDTIDRKFQIKDFNSTTANDEIREFNKKCDERYPCSDRSKYKKNPKWRSYWKKRFDRCLQERLLLTCESIRKYVVSEELEKAKDLYKKIGFESGDYGKLIILDTLLVNLTTVQKWSDSCLRTLIVSCGNFSKYLGSDKDYGRSKKEYATVSFLVNPVEKFYYGKQTKHLSMSFVKEYTVSCQNKAFKTTSCRDRFQIKDTKGYFSISSYFFERCSWNELRVNCSTVQNYLNGIKGKYSRVVADYGRNDLRMMEINGEVFMKIKEECDGRIPCSERERYKKDKLWLSYWKKKFDRCLKDQIVFTCFNETSEKQLKTLSDQYRTFKFVHESEGKMESLDPSEVSLKFLKKWFSSCSKSLTVACGNFTKYLYSTKNFNATKAKYNSVIFMIDNIDEKFVITKNAKTLIYNFVNEFRHFCQEKLFKTTLCKDRVGKFKSHTFQTIYNLFNKKCSQNELLVDCTNVEKISADKNLYKSKYHRVAFLVEKKMTIEMFNKQTITNLLKNFMEKCNSGIPCSKRNDYKNNKNWKTYWKKHFDKCLKPLFSLSCSNITNYLTPKSLENAKNHYSKFMFISGDPGRKIVLDTLQVTLNVLNKWQQSCVLTLSCSNFTNYLKPGKYKNTIKNYQKITFVVDNIHEPFSIEKRTSKLPYNFVEQYNSSCYDSTFKITICNDRFDLYKNNKYENILMFFFRQCSLNERYINCSNIQNYKKQDVLQNTIAKYERIFIDYGAAHFQILNVNDPNITNVIKYFNEKCDHMKITKKPRIISSVFFKRAKFEEKVKEMRESYEETKNRILPFRRFINSTDDVSSKLRKELKRYRGLLEKVNMTKAAPQFSLNPRTREAILNTLKERLLEKRKCNTTTTNIP